MCVFQLGDRYKTSVAHSTNHILSLLTVVARGDSSLVVSVILDRVAPHLPSDSAPWLPGEGPRSTSLEWSVHIGAWILCTVLHMSCIRSLSVKQQFDQHPLLWHLLLFSTHCELFGSVIRGVVCSAWSGGGCSFSLCEPLVCSLLLVLTQHWFSCRCSNISASGRELHSCEWLVESLAAVGH